MSKAWSHSVGQRPHVVRVFERAGRRGLYVKYHGRKEALGHSDRKRAKQEAADRYARLLKGHEEPESITLGGLFARYLQNESQGKARPKEDERRAALWARFLGGKQDPHRISSAEWDSFIRLRRSGEIDALGKIAEAPRPVGDRTIEADCKWLSAVLTWGSKRMHETGGYLLRENCVRGYAIPKEKNPRRAVATRDRYEAALVAAETMAMEVRWNGKAETRRSYLAEFFEVAVGTGRRLSAVRQLRREDLRLDVGPHGAIRWPADTDKGGRESVVPIDATVRTAIDRRLADRPILGRAYLFPSASNLEKPVSRYVLDHWLRKAEKLAGLEPLEGTLWHAYRRKWATERKHHPAQDVARAGGWSGVETLQTVYQQPDEETMLRAVLEPMELRHAR